jgi:hypothetical protein
MATGWTADQEEDDAGTLRRHPSRRGASGDELRSNDRRERSHEFVDRQPNGVLAVAVLMRRWADSVEDDVDAARVVRHGLDVGLDRGTVGRIDLRGVRVASVHRDSLRRRVRRSRVVTENLAVEVSPAGVRVICLRMTANGDSRTIQETVDALALRMRVPKDEMLKRVASLNFLKVLASDTARAAAFLASDRARTMIATVVNSTAGTAAD